MSLAVANARSPIPFLRVLLVVLLALGGVFVVPPGTKANASTEGNLSVGTVTWGIKKSWRDYMSTSFTVDDGLTVNEDGTYDFPVHSGSFDPTTNSLNLSLSGRIHYAAYCTDGACLLDSEFSDLSVEISPHEQVIRGTYVGNDREDPSKRERLENVVLGVLDITRTEPTVENGETTWEQIPATAGEGLVLYHAGVSIDPVTIHYTGDGGMPDISEYWEPEGLPQFTESVFSESLDQGTANKQVFADGDGKTIHLVEFLGATRSRYYEVRALDAQTLETKAFQRVELAAVQQAFRVIFDAKRSRFFFGSSTLSGTTYQLFEFSYDAESGTYNEPQEIANLEVPDVTEQATAASLVWNEARQVLAVLYLGRHADRTVDHRLFELSVDDDGQWSHLEFNVDEVFADVFPQPVTNPLGVPDPADAYASKSFAVARDGSYVYVNSGQDTVTSEYLPVLSIRTKTDETVEIVPIEGSKGYYVSGETRMSFPYNSAFTAADGSVMLYGSVLDVKYVDVVEGETNVIADGVLGNQLAMLTTAAPDKKRGYDYVHSVGGKSVYVISDKKFLSVFPLPYERSLGTTYPIAVGGDGALFVQTGATNKDVRIQRFELVSISPTITQQPVSRDVTVLGAGSKQVTFTAAATGEPAPAVQWQQRPVGNLKFTDIAGATSTALTVNATTADSGTEYRAVFSNAGGAIATAPALLTVTAAPVFTSSPASITTKTGASALFQAQVIGSPAPTISWEVNKGSGWTTLASSGSVHIEDGMLVIRDIDETWADAQLRAVAVNTAGTVRSQVARLTLEKAADTEQTFTGVVLDWTGSQEWQAKPPNGSAANYFSAGVSDGTKETHTAKKDGASILLRSTSGKDTQATYATRAQHITDDNTEAQVIQLTDGTAIVQPDGSAEVTWPATVSVNFYDGLVPFTMSDFALTVDKAGTGKLVANLSGYSGDMSDPDKPKEPVKPAKNVTVATFKNVVVNTEKGFTVAPEFAGVTVELPTGHTAQVRTGNWGAWPQQFVDFHVSTGLAAYFYTTGGTFDKNKAPAGFAVGFENAIPQVPTNPVEPTQPEEPSKPTVPTDPNLPGTPNPGQTVQGSLVWGVKESFRKYINGPIANGKVSVSDGAIISNDVYWFGQDTTTWKSGSTSSTTNYKGAVKFYGHKGELDVTFSKPVVRIDSATKGTLLITANGKSAELATLDLRNATVKAVQGGISYSNVPVTLTASGAKLFAYGDANFYEAGTEMDPLTFVIGEKATDTPTKVTTPKKNPAKNSGKNNKDTDKTSDDAPITTKDGVTQGSLVWGVKNSFRSYITGPIAKGSITVQNGAASQGGAFWFGQSETNWKKDATTSTTRYSGAVKFYGHQGVLNLTLGNPAVRVDSASKGTLLVNVNGGGQVEFATLNLAAASKKNVTGGVSYSGVPVTLTAAGSTAFAYGSSNFYPAGTSMDSLSFVIGGTATAAPSGTNQVVAGHDEDENWTPPATPPATTGILIDPELLENLTAGSELTAIADGFEPNEEDIKVVVYSEPVVLEQKLKADAQGQATWTGLLPADLEPGTHTLTFQGSVDRGIVFEIVEAAEPEGCYISAAELEWGFKGTFRNYISGGIAKGEWTLTDGVTFSDPHFVWKDGTGAFDTEESAGEVTLPGTIQFTGHDGLLNTSIANPTIKITDASTAYLLLDVSGVSMEDALSGNEDNVQTYTQIPFVELDLSAAPLEIGEDGVTYTATEVPARLTTQGYEAFPNYDVGTEFDPVSFTFTVAEDCLVDTEPEPVVEETPEGLTPISAPGEPEDEGINWVLWGGSGVGAAALLTALVWFVRKRSLDTAQGASSLTDGE